jgi:hypothetical protein
MSNAAQLERIINNDDAATQAGLTIARVLKLKPTFEGEEGGKYPTVRYNTQWGTKTPCGLARTVLAILYDDII